VTSVFQAVEGCSHDFVPGRVSVIVPTRNSGRTIANCLSSLRSQDYRDLETIVVDNDSTDGTREVAERLADVVFSAGPERSTQRNLGAARSTGEFLVFIDSDMIIPPTLVGEIAQDFRTKSEVTALVLPERAIGTGFWAQCRMLEKDLYLGDEDVEAARAFRRSAFSAAGGYDERIHAGGEDWDLPERIAATGGHVDRISTTLLHDEGRLRLRENLTTKLYYGRSFGVYAGKNPQEAARKALRLAFVRRRRLLARKPLHAVGLGAMKVLELLALLTGMTIGRISTHPADRTTEDGSNTISRRDRNPQVSNTTRPDGITPAGSRRVERPVHDSSERREVDEEAEAPNCRLEAPVSAVIVNYEGGELLLDCVASLEQPDVAETILVDNGSDDGSADAAAARFPGLKVLTPRRNIGFAEGANYGAREARGELLLFLNPDIRLPTGAVRALAAQFADPGVGVVGPPLQVESAGTVEYGATVDVIGSPVGLTRSSSPLYVSGCALMTRATLFHELGAFDGRFFMFFEDVDYCWRVLLRGFDVKVPDIEPVWHLGGAVTPGGYISEQRVSSTTFRIALRERNTLAVLLKCYRAPLVSIVVVAYVLQCLLTAGLFAGRGQLRTARAVVAGLRWNVRELPRTLELRRRVQTSRKRGDTLILRRMYRGIWKLHLLVRFGLPTVSEEGSTPAGANE
jgi:GT2 family glycosyltransferase